MPCGAPNVALAIDEMALIRVAFSSSPLEHEDRRDLLVCIVDETISLSRWNVNSQILYEASQVVVRMAGCHGPISGGITYTDYLNFLRGNQIVQRHKVRDARSTFGLDDGVNRVVCT